MIDDDLDNNPALALLEAAWFDAICPRCDELHALPLHPIHLAALENEAGSRAVDARFDAIKSNPPAAPGSPHLTAPAPGCNVRLVGDKASPATKQKEPS